MQVPEAKALSVEPASEDDWELVEIHADYMEEQLLNQVRFYHSGKFALAQQWMHPSA